MRHPNRVELAPIALFTYNRPEHVRRTVESLRANHLAQQSDLFVFSDGAKDHSGSGAVAAVRKFVRTINGFKSVMTIERERNLGLGASVIAGVTALCQEFARVIVVEDDLLTTTDFLTFMNRGLQRYANEPRVHSLSGFNYAVKTPEGYPYDVFFTYRSSSWGWGTWKDRWATADWTVPDYACFKSDKNFQRLFNRGGQDLSRMLDLQMIGRLDSWAIRWAYAHYKNDALTLLPVRSRIFNIGMDGSGINCRAGSSRQSPLTCEGAFETRFPPCIEADSRFAMQIYRAHRVSVVRRWTQVLLRSFKKERRPKQCFQPQRIAR